jgi:hypothetical protein
MVITSPNCRMLSHSPIPDCYRHVKMVQRKDNYTGGNRGVFAKPI